MLRESLNDAFKRRVCSRSVPLVLPASLKAASDRIMPNISWDIIVVILPSIGSGRLRVRREPDAVRICCSFVPANCPRMACVVAEGGCTVRAYMNIEEVMLAMVSLPAAWRPQVLTPDDLKHGVRSQTTAESNAAVCEMLQSAQRRVGYLKWKIKRFAVFEVDASCIFLPTACDWSVGASPRPDYPSPSDSARRRPHEHRQNALELHLPAMSNALEGQPESKVVVDPARPIGSTEMDLWTEQAITQVAHSHTISQRQADSNIVQHVSSEHTRATRGPVAARA